MTCAPGTYSADDDGGGPYDPATGVREWYQPKSGQVPEDAVTERSWVEVLAYWADIEMDLQESGIDIEDRLDTRTWRWLKLRINHYASTPGTNLWDALHPKAAA